MQGKLYVAYVVANRQLQVPGTTNAVPISEIVFTYPGAFLAANDDVAKGLALAAAAAKGVNINDPLAPVEVVLR